jgi:hypothetical protein
VSRIGVWILDSHNKERQGIMETFVRVLLGLVLAGSLACGGDDTVQESEYPDIRQLYQDGERDFHEANLPGIDLSRATLSGANFSGANLSGANLSNADLNGANFSNADLSGADLKRAFFKYASLSNANLQDADLREATLDLANLRGANLSDANLEGATYDSRTVFPDGFDPGAHGMSAL